MLREAAHDRPDGDGHAWTEHVRPKQTPTASRRRWCPSGWSSTPQAPGWTCLTPRVGALLEVIVGLGVIVLVGLLVWAIVSGRSTPSGGEVVAVRPGSVSDRHKHRWTRWQILEERRIHLYGEVDEGRELPDRIDVVLRRECARCGLPQTQTVRGLDADRRGG